MLEVGGEEEEENGGTEHMEHRVIVRGREISSITIRNCGLTSRPQFLIVMDLI